MEPLIGLKFILKNGFFQTVETQGKALQIVDQFYNSTAPHGDGGFKFRGENPLDRREVWSVDLNSILAVHTFIPRDEKGIELQLQPTEPISRPPNPAPNVWPKSPFTK